MGRIVPAGLVIALACTPALAGGSSRGDLQVNLSDAGLFTSDLFGSYARRSDFNNDRTVNLSDAGVMVAARGGACP